MMERLVGPAIFLGLLAAPFVLAFLFRFLFLGGRTRWWNKIKARRHERASRSKRISAAWRIAARKLTGADPDGEAISVQSDGATFRVEPIGPGGLKVRVTTTGECGIPRSVKIFGSNENSLEAEPVRGREFQTGDPEFDRRVALAGDPAFLLAALDRDLRSHLAHHAKSDEIRIEDGAIAWTSGSDILNSRGIVRRVKLVRDLAESLRDIGGDIPRRLADHATKDRVLGVRLANLRVLNEKFPEAPETREANRKALRDDNPEVRILAAPFVGEEGLQVLSRLATWAPKVVSSIRIRAFRRLVESSPRATALGMLDDYLENGKGRRLLAAVYECGRLRHRAAVPKLIAFLDSKTPALSAEAACALGDIGDPSAEQPLIEALRSGRGEILLAVVAALGRAGTVRAVAPLQEAALWPQLSPNAKAATEAAVAAIQARVPGADRGQLEITEVAQNSGGLSLAKDSAGGEVSLPEREQA